MNRRHLATLAIRALDDFFSHRLWLRLQDEQILVAELEDGTPFGVSVFGSAGCSPGLALWVGEVGLQELVDSAQGLLAIEERSADSVRVSLCSDTEVPAGFLPWLDLARRQGRIRPAIWWRTAGGEAAPLDETKLEQVALVCAGLIRADEAGMLEPGAPFETGRTLVLKVTGGLPRPEVEVDQRQLPKAQVGPDPVASTVVPKHLQQVARGSHRLSVHLLEVPFANLAGETTVMFGEPEDDEGTLEDVLLVMDLGSEKLVLAEPLEFVDDDRADDLEDEEPTYEEVVQVAAETLSKRLTGEKSTYLPMAGAEDDLVEGLPAAVIFAHRKLFEVAAPDLMAAGVECSWDPEEPQVLHAALELLGVAMKKMELAASDKNARDRGAASDGSGSELPEPGDLDGWKLADRAAIRALMAAGGRNADASVKPWKKYLGAASLERLEELADAFGDMLSDGYMDWFVCDYRSDRRSRTVLERALVKPQPEALQLILEAKQAAQVSLYRVEDCQVGESLRLVNVLGGKEIVLHDRSMSLSARPGAGLVLRVYPAGAFHFATVMGPTMDAVKMTAQLHALSESHGLDLSGEGIRPEQRHFLGRLWEGVMDAADQKVAITNTHGESLAQAVAEFSVVDPDKLLRFFETAKEVVEEEPGSLWSWVEDGILLGHLEFFGDDVVTLEANSMERLDSIRARLESVDGVAFSSSTDRPFEVLGSKGPADDRLPKLGKVVDTVALPADSLEALQGFVDQHYLTWCDTELPMLDGKTPRQVCKTKAGQATVRALIEAIAPPPSSPGVTVPKARMMKELGLG